MKALGSILLHKLMLAFAGHIEKYHKIVMSHFYLSYQAFFSVYCFTCLSMLHVHIFGPYSILLAIL